jgi:Cu/Ag efflux pump CusA
VVEEAAGQARRQHRLRPRADGSFSGGEAVVLTINKQPTAPIRGKSRRSRGRRFENSSPRCPTTFALSPIYSQRAFIDRAIDNVVEALADGGILVVLILFCSLMNFRTTFITLTAIPLSLVITALVFAAFGLVDQHDDARRPGRGDRGTGR